MSNFPQAGVSVLIIDPDAGIRNLVETVLQYAGFDTFSTDDPEMAAAESGGSSFAVILRDLNLCPGASRRTLRQLADTAPELLRRTVIMTTAPARAASAVRAGTVSAIVCKPFDIDELVNAVRACARDSRGSRRDEKAAGPAPPPSRQSAPDRATMKIESLRRFVMSGTSLQQRLLAVPLVTLSETALGAEADRVLGALSAAPLARGPVPVAVAPGTNRDH